MNLRNRRSRLLLAVVVAIFVIVTALLLVRSRFGGPSYGGRSLAEWVKDYGRRDSNQLLAAEAIRAIGTNALPSLLKWLDYQPSNWRIQAQPLLILIRCQNETNSGRVAAWRDHAGLIHSS